MDTSTTSLRDRLWRRLGWRTLAAVVGGAAMVGAAVAIAPHLTSQSSTRDVADATPLASSAKLTCRDFNGAGFINWDIEVQLNRNGTAASASALGNAYLTGLQLVTVERTGQADIQITQGGRHLAFHSDALIATTIPGTSLGFSGPSQGCSATFDFPNPASPFTNLVPSS
jgi:hypothetical protein